MIMIYFAIKQMSDAMTTKVVLNDAAPPFSDTDDVLWERCPMPEL